MIVLLPENELPAGADARRTVDDFGYFVTNWRYLAHDSANHPEGPTEYYDRNGNQVDTSICRRDSRAGRYGNLVPDGEPWSEFQPHCYDNVFRISYFNMPSWLQHG